MIRPASTCNVPRMECQGGWKETCGRRFPVIQSSPSGWRASRAKNPPDIAATAWPPSSLQTSATRWADAPLATLTTVLRNACFSTWTVVLRSSERTRRSLYTNGEVSTTPLCGNKMLLRMRSSPALRLLRALPLCERAGSPRLPMLARAPLPVNSPQVNSWSTPARGSGGLSTPTTHTASLSLLPSGWPLRILRGRWTSPSGLVAADHSSTGLVPCGVRPARWTRSAEVVPHVRMRTPDTTTSDHLCARRTS